MDAKATKRWRVRLFDGPVLEGSDGEEIVRFRSSKVRGLLAFLALRLDRRCPREEIADALWPDEIDATATANRLRVALASLRRQLEPPPMPFGSVLDVSAPGCVRLREATVDCDVAEFDRAYAAGRRAEAAALLRGPLLPGLYDEWARSEQLRFEALRDDLAESNGAKPLGAASDAPRPSPERRLPLYLTRFFEGDGARSRLVESLATHRLTTLTGPGGIGKTRLAVEAAAGATESAVFVSLAALDDPIRIPETIAQALGILSRTLDEPMAQLCGLLSTRSPTLLVLDNVEGALDATAETVLELLSAAPTLRVLVTSRQRLDVPGEAVVAVLPLDVPPSERSREDFERSASVSLFVDRARNVVPDFVVRERHIEPLATICRLLEGMPLALELAAARVAVQSLPQIAAALDANLMDLRSRQRGLSERHRSLRAAIQGSFDTLPMELQRFFVRLSAFRGGWTAEAAAFVGDEPDAERLLEELAMRSLVLVREDDSAIGIRYSLLGPLRAFAEERSTSEEIEACRRRHTAYFVGLAARATEDDLRTLAPLDAETENLQYALDAWPRDAKYWGGLAGALVHAFVRGRHRQASRWIEASAEAVANVPDPAIRFRWRYAACLILPDIGRLEETEAIARAMREDSEATGDAHGGVYAAVVQGYVEEFRGSIERTLAIGGAALDQARSLESRHLLETCLSHRSGTLHVYGALVGAGTPEGRATLATAESLARELCAIVPPYSRRLALGPLLVAAALWPQGRTAEAYDRFKDAQAAAIRLGTTTELMYAFVSEGVIAAEWGFHEHAALLYGAFGALQERMGYSLARAQSSRPAWIEDLGRSLGKTLGEEAFQRLATQGRAAPAAAIAARRVD